MTPRFWLLLFLALALGVFLGWMDSRPHWDDTGVTVISLLVSAAVFGAIMPRHAWVWGLAVGIWIPIFEFGTGSGPFVAPVVALIGAYGGALGSKAVGVLGGK